MGDCEPGRLVREHSHHDVWTSRSRRNDDGRPHWLCLVEGPTCSVSRVGTTAHCESMRGYMQTHWYTCLVEHWAKTRETRTVLCCSLCSPPQPQTPVQARRRCHEPACQPRAPSLTTRLATEGSPRPDTRTRPGHTYAANRWPRRTERAGMTAWSSRCVQGCQCPRHWLPPSCTTSACVLPQAWDPRARHPTYTGLRCACPTRRRSEHAQLPSPPGRVARGHGCSCHTFGQVARYG